MAPLPFNFLVYLLLSSHTLKACLWMSSRALLSSHPLLVSPPWPVHLLLDTPSQSIGAEAPVLWPPDVKSWLTEKDPDAGKDWRQEEKGTTEDEMVGWHHWLNGHEFEHALGDGKGQGSLGCCSLGVTKSWTQLSNWTTATIQSLGCLCCPLLKAYSTAKITYKYHFFHESSPDGFYTELMHISSAT